MNDLHIVTVATESKYYFPYLVESCKRHGKKLEVLGFGEKWTGLSMKIRLMVDYLKKIPENDIVCFVDGYDVICVRDLNELKGEFIRLSKTHNCKIIVAEDKHQNILFSQIGIYMFGNNINSGTYMGYSKDILNLLTTIRSTNNKDSIDDQILINTHYNSDPTIFFIDYNSELFYTKCNILQEIDKDVIVSNNEVYFNNNKPFFIHAPSGYFDGLLTKLNYNYVYNYKINDQVFQGFFTDKIIKSTLGKYIMYFLCIIIVILFIFIIYKRYIRNITKYYTKVKLFK